MNFEKFNFIDVGTCDEFSVIVEDRVYKQLQSGEKISILRGCRVCVR